MKKLIFIVAYILISTHVWGASLDRPGPIGAQAPDTAVFTKLNFSASSELTIASDAITVTKSFHTVDTETDASTDSLKTISGGADGQLLYLLANNSGRIATLNETDNIVIPLGTTLALSTTAVVPLIYDDASSKWIVAINLPDILSISALDMTSATSILGTVSVADGYFLSSSKTTQVGSGAISVTVKNANIICTGACQVTLPVASAGNEYCVQNAPGSATIITLVNRASQYYELTDHSAWATVNQKLVSGGVATDSICVAGYDATHYTTKSFVGTWTDTAP